MLSKLKWLFGLGWPLLTYEAFNRVYDLGFYPYALYRWGLGVGGTIVVLGSLISCAFLFWLYDYMKVDWLGVKALAKLEESEDKNWLEKLVSTPLKWVTKMKSSRFGWVFKPLSFILMNISIDPLIVAVHHRENHFGGISKRDWGVLLASVAVANFWWILRIGILVKVFQLAKVLWNMLF